MVPATEMDPVLVRKALMDLVVVLKTVKKVVMTQILYVHHVRKGITEISVMRHVQIIVNITVHSMKEHVMNVLKVTGDTPVVKVSNVCIPI